MTGIVRRCMIYLLPLFTFLGGEQVFCQEPKKINLNECVYLCTGNDVITVGTIFNGSRAVWAKNDSIQKVLAKSLQSAINAYWDAGLDNLYLDVKDTESLFRDFPKFKPKVPKKYSDKWELFFRVVDRGIPFAAFAFNETNSYAGTYLMECKVLNGSDGSEIFSRSMQVVLERGFKPDGCFVLQKIPCIQESFIRAFDNAFKAFFSTGAPEIHTEIVKPACLYIDLETAGTIEKTIRFEREGNAIGVTDGPSIAFAPYKMEREKTGKAKRTGSGIGSGIIALVGVSNSKDRTKSEPFITRLKMEDIGTGVMYEFHLPIMETTIEEVSTNRVKNSDGSRSFEKEVGATQFNRAIDGICHILRGNDTIGNFEVFSMMPDKTKESLKYLWDGRDSATIMLMPDGWGIEGDYKLLGIAGELYGKKFQFNNSKGGNQLDVWYNQQQVATFKVENGLPKDGILYKADAPEEVLKVFAMFCALPYSYYN